MKNWQDIVNKANAEAKRWFTEQCRRPSERFFWKYSETTKDLPGDIWIADEDDNTYGFWLCPLNSWNTKEQNVSEFLKVAGKLPILEYK